MQGNMSEFSKSLPSYIARYACQENVSLNAAAKIHATLPTTDGSQYFISSSSGRPSTARNYNVVSLDTGFYPQTTAPNHETLTKQWALQGFQWVSCSDGQMLTRAVQNGYSRAGEPLYIARALSPGMTHCIGIFHPSSGQCFFFWQGREYRSKTYDILCRVPKLQSRISPVATSIPTLGDSLRVMTLRNPLKLSNYGRI